MWLHENWEWSFEQFQLKDPSLKLNKLCELLDLIVISELSRTSEVTEASFATLCKQAEMSTMWIPVFNCLAASLVSRSKRSVEFMICLIPNQILIRPWAVLLYLSKFSFWDCRAEESIINLWRTEILILCFKVTRIARTQKWHPDHNKSKDETSQI